MLNLITSADILKVDQAFVHKAYEKWPEHFKQASNIKAKSDHDASFYKSLVFCGVGGSGTSSDILHEVAHYSGNISSTVLKGEHIPEFVNKRSLVIVNSVSGNTSEAIEMLKGTAKQGAEVICISSGGRLKEEAVKQGLKHIDIPNLSLPRASLPYLLMPGLNILAPLLQKPLDISSLYRSLKQTEKKVSLSVPYENNVSKQIASFMEGGMAFCFTSPQMMSSGTRFKNSLNENSKLHCLSGSVMESSHNEIVPFTFNNNLQSKILLLRWIMDSADVEERFGRFKALFKRIGRPFIELMTEEESLLHAIVSSIYILDYATIYIAVSRGIDPSPTPAIDILKNLDQRRDV